MEEEDTEYANLFSIRILFHPVQAEDMHTYSGFPYI